MALIQKIREKSWLLLIAIGLGLLGFIISEVPQNNVYKFYAGEVFGKKVEMADYETKLQQVQLQDQQQLQQQGKPYTAEDEANSVEKAWNTIVDEKILQREFEALQLSVSDKEVDAYLLGVDGFKLDPKIEKQFTDSTGKFNRRLLEQRLNQMKTSKDAKDVQNWKQTEEGVKQAQLYNKYSQLLNLTAYVSTLEAENAYVGQNEMKEVSFVGKKFTDIDDNEIHVSNDQLKKYYDEHKDEKKWAVVSPNRDVHYFEVPIRPSTEDVKAFNDEMNTLKNKFQKTKNDSLFVIANSDIRLFSKDHRFTFLPEGNPKAQQGLTYPVAMDSIFKHAPVGTVVGPYQQGTDTRIAKVLDHNKYLLSCRHILLAATDSASVKKQEKLADSLIRLINKDNFGEYVTKYSTDQGSIAKGGEYDDFLDYTMVPEFSKFCVDNPVGKIGWVKTQFGIHIIEVLKKEEVNYPILAVVQKTLVPSEQTENEAQNLAYDMIEKIDSKVSKIKEGWKKVAMFDTIARKNNFMVANPITIYDYAPKVYNFTSQNVKDNIIKLAYDKDSENGTLASSPFKDPTAYVVCMVGSSREKGTPNYEDVKELMKRELVKDLKSKRIASQLQGAKTLEAAAQKINQTIQTANVTFANPQLGSAGSEPKIVGALFDKMKDGQMTAPIEGDFGTYVVRINKTTKAPKTENFETQRQQLLSSEKNGTYNAARAALYKIAEPKDFRKFNQLGIITK